MKNARFCHLPGLMILWAVCAGLSPTGASGTGEVVLVVEARPAAPVEHGMAELTRALAGKGLRAVRHTALAADDRACIVIGQAGAAPGLDKLLQKSGCVVPGSLTSLDPHCGE
jgi:hypothetical protein